MTATEKKTYTCSHSVRDIHKGREKREKSGRSSNRSNDTNKKIEIYIYTKRYIKEIERKQMQTDANKHNSHSAKTMQERSH